MRTRQEFLARHWANEQRAVSLISEAVTASILLYPVFDPSILENAYKRLYSLVMKSEAEKTWEEFMESDAETVSQALMFMIYEYIGIYVGVRITEVLMSIFTAIREKIPSIVTDLERNEFLREFAKQQEYRVRSLARTETTRAMNRAAIIAMQQSGLPWEKSWIAVLDEHTRNAHAVKSPVEYIPIDEAFVVGGEQLFYPADTSLGATAGNVINCRCSMDFRIRRGR